MTYYYYFKMADSDSENEQVKEVDNDRDEYTQKCEACGNEFRLDMFKDRSGQGRVEQTCVNCVLNSGTRANADIISKYTESLMRNKADVAAAVCRYPSFQTAT